MINKKTKELSINPILNWTMLDIWNYIELNNIPHCCLYDEGWDRLGCVGCTIPGPIQQNIEFDRWPRYRHLWHKAVIANWEFNNERIKRNGQRTYHANFKSGEELWDWWMMRKKS